MAENKQDLMKEYFEDSGDNDFSGLKYLMWLEKKLLESRQEPSRTMVQVNEGGTHSMKLNEVFPSNCPESLDGFVGEITDDSNGDLLKVKFFKHEPQEEFSIPRCNLQYYK